MMLVCRVYHTSALRHPAARPHSCVLAAAPRARLPVLASAPRAPWSSVAVYEVGQQGALAGPFDAEADAAAVAALPGMGYSHFAYVAVK